MKTSCGMNLQNRIWHTVGSVVMGLGLLANAHAVTLHGRLIDHSDPDRFGLGKGGVDVTLSGTSSYAVTKGDGSWTIGDLTAISPKTSLAKQAMPAKVVLEEPGAGLRFGDRDLRGRHSSMGTELPMERPMPGVAARIHAAAPDTLVYLYQGKEILRDTVTVIDQPEIVRIFNLRFNPKIIRGYFVDARDQHQYATVKIANQTWMAGNLNYAGPNKDVGVCFNRDSSFCNFLGRLYSWSQAMGIDNKFNQEKWNGQDQIQPGICPEGWHLPNDADWNELLAVADFQDGVPNRGVNGVNLRSVRIWREIPWFANGVDRFGFSALPAGFHNFLANTFEGDHGYWWSASESDTGTVTNFQMSFNKYNVDRNLAPKSYGYSVRCVKN